MQWSIIVPTYNYGRYIERCLLSILGQSGNDYEIVVVDDGSTDDTCDIIQRFMQTHKVPVDRLHLLRQTNQGPAAARNYGIAKARGTFIWFLDSDDRLVPNALEFLRLAVENHPDGEMFFGGYRSISQCGATADKLPGDLSSDRTENFRRFLRKDLKSLTTGAVVVRKAALGELRFPEGIHINEDVAFFGQLIANVHTVALPRVLVEKMRHPASLRGNLDRIEETGLRSVDALFDPAWLNPEQMKLRSTYRANRCLRLFRAHYLAGNHARARAYYAQALQISPRCLLKGSYLLKFLLCLGK